MIIGACCFDFSNHPYVMGILNVTPDSFSDGGRYLDPEKALDQALKMQEEGADLIDVGGESTRPGSDPVSVKEELARILPVLKKIVPRLKVPVSIDTRKGVVAEQAIGEGVSLVNDVSALTDPLMIPLLASKKIPVILMHMRGTPKTMQDTISYQDVVAEIHQFFKKKLEEAIHGGVQKSNILLDPGIGFGKRFEDNLLILQHLENFQDLGCPLAIGVSRKSFLKKLLGDHPQDLLIGSVNTALHAAKQGVSLLRVHDVRETKTAIRLAKGGQFL